MGWDPSKEYKSAEVASTYDAIRFRSIAGRIFNRREQNIIIRCFSALATGSTIADVPCGTGRLAAPLLRHGYQIHGIDISPNMLQVAADHLKSFGPRFTCETMDVMAIGERHAIYDGVLCARVLMHFPLHQQIEFLEKVSTLSDKIVVINHGLDTPYHRFRHRVKKLLGMNAVPARFPIKPGDIPLLLAKAKLVEVKRYRMMRFLSEAVYIVTCVDERQ